MKDKEKKPVGSCLTQKVLGVEDNKTIGLLEACLVFLLVLFVVIPLYTVFIAK